MKRSPIILPLLPSSSTFLRQRSRDVPPDRNTRLELFGWPAILRTAYAGEDVTIADVLLDLRATFDKHQPYGLAAPQVGIGLRIILVRGNEALAPTTLINPKILSREGARKGQERCLSLPGVKRMVRRAAGIVVEGVREDGELITIGAHGLLAAVIQHEVDHLDGVLMTAR
jgi:peptide deformylase